MRFFSLHTRLYRDTSSEDRWDLVLTGHLDKRAEQLKSLADTLGIGTIRAFQGAPERRGVCRTI